MRNLASRGSDALCLLLLLLGSGGVAGAQSAFTRPRNTGYARVSVSTLTTSNFFTPLGTKISSARYSGFSGGFYGEYGLTGNLTAAAYVPFIQRHQLDTTGTLTAPGDSIVGLKYRVLRGKTPVAVAVDFGIPSGDPEGLVAINDLLDSSFRLPTGDGELNTRLSLYISRAFREGRNTISAGAGYNIRTQGFTDEINYFVNGSHRLFRSVTISGSMTGLVPARPPNVGRSVGFGVGEGVEFLTFGGDVQYRLSRRYSVSVGYYMPVKGKNLLAGGGLVTGFGIAF